MAGRLKDTPRRGSRASAEYAREIADLFVRYEEASLTNWRIQSEIWTELRKRLAQYKLALKREEKESRRQLWEKPSQQTSPR